MKAITNGSPVLKLAAFLSIIFLTGCAGYFKPMLKPIPRDTSATKVMPNLSLSLKKIDESIVEIQEKRDGNIQTGRILNLATFGLGAGAGAYGLHSGHANAIKNLAYASGATYVGANLFAPLDHSIIYDSGIQALSCISQKGDTLRALMPLYEYIRNEKNAYIDSCDAANSKDQYAAVLDARQKAIFAYDFAEKSDMAAASQVTTAAQNVVNKVNSELLKRSNSPEAILNAAKSLSSFATANTFGQPNEVPVGNAQGAKNAGEPPCDGQRLTLEVNRYQQIEKTLTDAINVTGSLNTACTQEITAILPLNLSAEQITVKQGVTHNIIISGGRPIYSKNHSSPPDGLSVQLILPNTLVVTGTKAPTTSEELIVTISDSSAIALTKELKITFSK